MRQSLSKLESSILYHIDTGNSRKSIKEEVTADTRCSVKEVDQAIKKLRLLGLLRYEDAGTYLIANFAQHHGKDIKFDQTMEVYTYEDGKDEPTEH